MMERQNTESQKREMTHKRDEASKRQTKRKKAGTENKEKR